MASRRPASAATLFGAIGTVRELTDVVVPAPWREAHDAALATAAAALGPAAFNVAFERGAVIPLIDA